ncbi:hypothetical protein F7725_023115, partial [Dissostichus mawsoni]
PDCTNDDEERKLGSKEDERERRGRSVTESSTAGDAEGADDAEGSAGAPGQEGGAPQKRMKEAMERQKEFDPTISTTNGTDSAPGGRGGGETS